MPASRYFARCCLGVLAIGVCLPMAFSQPAVSAGVAVRIKCREGVIAQPSLGQVARELRASHKVANTAPLYTNDNLPRSGAGLSILGPSTLRSAAPESTAPTGSANQAAIQQIAYLRGEIARSQTQLQLHQRELSVLQQQFGQSKMQWYPNPSQTLMQEYSRQNVAGLADKIGQKKRQIAEDQQAIDGLNDQLQRAQARYGWVRSAAQGDLESQIPPGLKPDTPEYFHARIEAAQRQLASAQEAVQVTQNELSLLKLQQLRSLNPNVQADLAARVTAKHQDLSSAQQSVETARQEIDELRQKLQSAAKPAK